MKKIFVIGFVSIFLLTAFPSDLTVGIKVNVKSVEKICKDLTNTENDFLFVPGELIIKFKDYVNIHTSKDGVVATDITSIDMLNKAYDVKSADKIFKTTTTSSLSNIYKLVLSESTNVILAAKTYSEDSNIEYTEPNYIYHICNIPNDPYFIHQWALNQSNDHDIDAPEAWDIETGNSNVIIAIIDSGVDYNHLDLVSNIWINDDETVDGTDTDGNGYIDDIRGYDFVDDALLSHPDEDGDEEDNDPMDFHGHGTHCAGIAAAVGNNSMGIAGVSWNCKIMPIRAGYKSSTGRGYFDLDSVAQGICYAVDNGANVISMSFGSSSSSILMKEVIRSAYIRGVVLVAAAGNENTDEKCYPAAFEEVIAVAASDRDDERASFSNYGDWVDVAAPGVEICSTYLNNSYTNLSGTSMSCPNAAGLAALIKSKDNSLSPNRIREIISYSVDRLDITFQMDRGRINARNALQRGTGNALAIIEKPKHCAEVKGIIGVQGTAAGEGFLKYIVEYSKGKDPETTIWIEIANSSLPIQNDELCSLDSTDLVEGIYIFRLRLICSDGVYTDAIWSLVNNLNNMFIVDDDGGADYTSIQDAVYDAGNGDSIYVKNGMYYEIVKIHKSIVLTGENKDSTIINGNRRGDIIHVFANNVNISGFTITNSSISGIGIFLDNSNNCIICCNNIRNNRIGIKLKNSKKNTIYKNNICNNFLGIRVAENSNKNLISHNNFLSDIPSILFGYASYKNSYFNRWRKNYWGRSRILPKRIPRRTLDDPLFFFPAILHRCNFDWRPALKPYEIPPTGINSYPGGA